MHHDTNPLDDTFLARRPALRDHVEIIHHDGAPLPPDDPRVGFLRAALTARAVITAIEPREATLPTPCAGWSVAELVRHVVAVHERVSLAPSGVDLAGIPTMATVSIAGAPATIGRLLAEIHQAWEDEARLGEIIDAPWGPTPGAGCLHVWAGELLMHTWDLAVSVGLTVDWPEPDVSIALQMSVASMPASRPADVPFDDAVPVDESLPPIERLAAWVGRDPFDPIRP